MKIKCTKSWIPGWFKNFYKSKSKKESSKVEIYTNGEIEITYDYIMKFKFIKETDLYNNGIKIVSEYRNSQGDMIIIYDRYDFFGELIQEERDKKLTDLGI